jgi:hypothetical protein
MSKPQPEDAGEKPPAAEPPVVTVDVEKAVAPTPTLTPLAFLQANFDDEAHVLYQTAGPKKSRIDSVTFILCEIKGVRRVIVATQTGESGAFRLYAEVPGRGPEFMADNLADTYS